MSGLIFFAYNSGQLTFLASGSTPSTVEDPGESDIFQLFGTPFGRFTRATSYVPIRNTGGQYG
jgi:hypothetical protein